MGPLGLATALVVPALLSFIADWLAVEGPASFSLQLWLYPRWTAGFTLLLAAMTLPPRSHAVASWYALAALACLPPLAVLGALGVARGHGWTPQALAQGWSAWAVYVALILWILLSSLRVAQGFGARGLRLMVLALGLVALDGAAVWQAVGSSWRAAPAAQDDEAPRPRLRLSQSTFETQQAVWSRAVEGLAPQRDGVADVYGLVFAPYAHEDVFLRESTMVAELLALRFDAAGRVLHLANHATTADRLPWATPENLGRAVAALARTMDRENDLLVVYLTSHGARDHRLAAAHWPLQVDPVSPQMLRDALDGAGIRHRVVAVSACYAGGWIEPLANDDTLVMTAADAEHTSYGCGRLSELTYFGRAVFDEQLRRTRSFEDAFAAAVPVIRAREDEAGKDDGFSNPQLRAGEGIRARLRALVERLERAG